MINIPGGTPLGYIVGFRPSQYLILVQRLNRKFLRCIKYLNPNEAIILSQIHIENVISFDHTDRLLIRELDVSGIGFFIVGYFHSTATPRHIPKNPSHPINPSSDVPASTRAG